MFKFTVTHDYGIILRLDIRRRYYNDHHNTNVGFPEWMKNTYNCTITYHYNSTAINTFNFNNQKDLNWFILQL
jgi:hypothetical protein